MPSAPSTFRGQTNAVGWLAVLRSAERSTVVQNENMVVGVSQGDLTFVLLIKLCELILYNS